jgi:hypothetical protein
MALAKTHSTHIPMEKHSTSSSLSHESSHRSQSLANTISIALASTHRKRVLIEPSQPYSKHSHKRRLFPKTNRLHNLPTKAGRTEKTMGSFDPTRLPYRPSHLSRLWRRAPRHCLHHRTQNHSKNLAPLAESKGRFSCSPYSRTSTYFRFLIDPARLSWTRNATRVTW